MPEQQTLQVTFMDGQILKFGFPRIQRSANNLSDLLQRARTANLLLEADGKLILIPTANVRMVELSPMPEVSSSGQRIPGLLTGAKQLK